jgi:hypothetical protein
MEALTSIGIYLLVLAGIFGVVFVVTFLKRKFGIKDEEIDLAYNIINFIQYIAKKSDFKYSGDIATVTRYVLLAISICEDLEEADTIEEKKELAINEALLICEVNGVNLDQELVGLVNEIIDYFVK